MTIILPVLGLSFAAFCVWLAVRIMNRRERWAKWTLAGVLAMPVLYVLSFGPACWWFSPGAPEPPFVEGSRLQQEVNLRGTTGRRAPIGYWPLGRLVAYGPEPVSRVIQSYATLHGSIDLPYDPRGLYFIPRCRR